MKEVYTIGCNGSTLPMVLSILKANGVTDLVDIRRYNWSKLSSFNRDVLSAMLAGYNINYHHEKGLAPSAKLLREYKDKEKTG